MTALNLGDIEKLASTALVAHGHAEIASVAASNCAWLEAVGYPGLKLLAEALGDHETSLDIKRDILGIDLENVSCVFIGAAVAGEVEKNGRAYLRNVRHGLYLVPRSVEQNYGIGCPVDPAFALGGERTKNPYAEKLAAAAIAGVVVDDTVITVLSKAMP